MGRGGVGGGAEHWLTGVGIFPTGLESLNGKLNRAIHCNHKSQEGGKTVQGQNCTLTSERH